MSEASAVLESSQQLGRPALQGTAPALDLVPAFLPQSSIQITFEELPQLPPRASISHVTCIDQSERTMVRVWWTLQDGADPKVPFTLRVLNLEFLCVLGT